MGLIVITTLFIFLTILWIPSASLHILVQPSHSQATEPLDFLPMPRKFRLLEEATVKADAFLASKPNNKQKQNISGKRHQRDQNKMHAGRGTGRERVELADKSSQFFAMDYTHIRRRRPVHNMSLQRP